jgi:hypothetical protein
MCWLWRTQKLQICETKISTFFHHGSHHICLYIIEDKSMLGWIGS